MKSYSSFIFDSYNYFPKRGVIELRYSLDDEVKFTETLTLPHATDVDAASEEEFDRALFALHLIGGVSYYKTCLPKAIDIRSGTLSPKQAEFWNSVYENGLGEFFFKNDIDFRGLINFPSHPQSGTPSHHPTIKPSHHLRTLVPVGGGKDSVVSVELLRKAKADITLFRVGEHPVITELARVMELPLFNVKRALAPELFKMNEAGALNGHIPITAYLSFLTVVISILHKFDSIAMSNEKSASEGNIAFHGKEINHQWSKSLEFEKDFQNYVASFITRRVEYGSLLRSMTELQVAEIFCKYPRYFHCATSCNTNWKILSKKEKGSSLWCKQCPKCAFVFTLFAAFLPKKTVIEIFGGNLFEDETLTPLFLQLLGKKGIKPFECVGTPQETAEAFRKIHAKKEFEGTPIMETYLHS